MEVILYSKECNWYTRCCPLNGGVRYRECPLREAILYYHHTSVLNIIGGFKGLSVLSVEISLNFTKLYSVLPVTYNTIIKLRLSTTPTPLLATPPHLPK